MLTAEIAAIDERTAALQAEKEAYDPECPKMYTIAQASQETGISYDHIRKLCLQKRITHIRAGSKYLINMGSLYRYLNEGETE